MIGFQLRPCIQSGGWTPASSSKVGATSMFSTMLFSPLKLFLPVAAAFFGTGLAYYAYTFLTAGRLTNMSTLLVSAAVIVFLIGLVSEQITSLTYLSARSGRDPT